MGREDIERTEAGCSKGTDGGLVSRLEVEVRGSGMQGDQRDESLSWTDRKSAT